MACDLRAAFLDGARKNLEHAGFGELTPGTSASASASIQSVPVCSCPRSVLRPWRRVIIVLSY